MDMNRGLRRSIRSAILGLSIAAVLQAQPASATFACSQGSGQVFVVINDNATGRLFVDAAGEVVLAMEGVLHPCGVDEDAAVSFNVNAGNGRETFLIDQGGPGGPFTDDRAWSIGMDPGRDVVGVLGRPGRDRVRVGQDTPTTRWIDLDGDGVAHHSLGDTELVRLVSRGGRDRLSGQGTPDGVLAPIRLPVVMKGGRGQDLLVGGSVDDRVAGGPGADRLLGKRGPDRLTGGNGTDSCRGGVGADTVASCEQGSP
jgi:Ca2+-binding RTX toxin-like protein